MPGAKRGAVNPIGRSAEARRGARIEVRVADPVAGRARAIIERVKIGIPNGLPRPAEPIKREEGRVADLLAGAGLGQRHTGKEQEEKWNGTPPGSTFSVVPSWTMRQGRCGGLACSKTQD